MGGIRLTMLVNVPQRRAPAAARTWLLLVFFLPWLGLLLYALFGRIYYPVAPPEAGPYQPGDRAATRAHQP
ncbi:PLDc N-terminal domain-containing protein [Cupriavidus basilensis]